MLRLLKASQKRLIPSSSSSPQHVYRRHTGNSTNPLNNAAYSSTRPPRLLLQRLSVTGAALIAVGLTFAWDNTYNQRTITRNFRTAWHGICIAIDYKINFDPDSLDAINALHERAANRLLHVCEKNGGLYVKLAQAIATQGAFLPAPYMRLAKLLDDAEKFDYSIVEQIIQSEFGAPISELFVRFDREPIAAASIAQVHRARIRLASGDEEEVAVKVQRPDIRRHAKWDLFAYRTLLRLYDRIFALPLAFAAQYISDQIEQETLFDNEAINSERIRHLVLSSPTPIIRDTVYVPRIHPSLSTSRVLTMEYIEDACKLTDLRKIESMGLSVKKVGRSVSEVFSAQVFQMGFVQADGHPSNVLVRKHPNGKRGAHQVVLIDHGLYVTLSPDFRHKYSRLWYAIFMQDMPTITEICHGWGIGQPELFASATLLKPWRHKQTENAAGDTVSDNFSEPLKSKEQQQLEFQRALKGKLATFLHNVELLPKELIFVGRAMRILQANNQVMGSPVNRINILARHAAAGLLHNPPASLGRRDHKSSISSSLRTFANSRVAFFHFRLTLFAIDVAFYVANGLAWFQILRHRFFGGGERVSSNKFEDQLEVELRDMARDKFGMQISEDAFDA